MRLAHSDRTGQRRCLPTALFFGSSLFVDSLLVASSCLRQFADGSDPTAVDSFSSEPLVGRVVSGVVGGVDLF